jgi:hypothetical protein
MQGAASQEPVGGRVVSPPWLDRVTFVLLLRAMSLVGMTALIELRWMRSRRVGLCGRVANSSRGISQRQVSCCPLIADHSF